MSGCFDVCDVWRIRFFIEGIRPWPFICGKCGKRINIKLRVFDPGRLLMVRMGNLNELTESKGCSTQATYLG